MIYPRISIVMPSFNQGKYIEESLISVLEQNYPNLEFMVLDGGSTDGSREIIERYADKLTYWHSQPDKGQADALNQGFKKASGSLLGWINSDDVLLKGSLKRIAHAYMENPQAGLIGGDYILIDEHGRIIRFKKHTKYAAWFGRHGLQVISPDWFFTRAAYQEVGGVNPSYEYDMDTDLFFRMVLRGIKFAYIESDLICFRLHQESKTSTRENDFHSEFHLMSQLFLDPNWKIERKLLKYLYWTLQTINGKLLRSFIKTVKYRRYCWREFENSNNL
ncbi:glycosyltransferase family 2 protein [Chloroflexota bacterium]